MVADIGSRCKVGFKLDFSTLEPLIFFRFNLRMDSPIDSRPASSKFRWIVCTLLFFSTTVNYMDRQVISYVKEYFCAPVESSLSTVSANELNVPVFADKLTHSTDAVSTYLKEQIPAATLAALQTNADAKPFPEMTNLLASINMVVKGQSIYDNQRFADVKLGDNTGKLLAEAQTQALSDDARAHLNRLLLNDAYPKALSSGGFGWSNSDFANVTSAFTGFYAGMTMVAGYVIDKIGTKIGLALALIIWSFFGILNAFIGSQTWMHMIVRSLFGIGEAANFPASIKTVAEWFPKRERALATGIFNSGSNVGAMISALFVPWCMIHFGDQTGWKMSYILTGSVGLTWLIFWFWLYNPPAKNSRVSKAEYDYIHSDKDEVQASTLAAQQPAKKGPGIFSFNGRVPSTAFWGMTIMISILCLFVYFITIKIVPDALHNRPTVIFFSIVGVIALWATLALHAKRWHDLGKSGWLALLNFIPGIGSLASIFILGFRHGDSRPNQFGNESGPGLLGHRQTWSFFAGKFMTDGVWWFYLFWLPDYLLKQFNMNKHQIMWMTFIVYGIAIIGSVYGGSVPMTLMKRGMPVYKARMTAMFLIALFPLTVLATQYLGDVSRFGSMAPVYAIAVICIGAAAHQAWSANLFTTVSDMFPKKSVGSVTGIGAMAGGLGGVIVQKIAGSLTDAFKSNPQHAYLIMFVICALSYLAAWVMMKALVPQHKPITDV
jgi:MFS family permease